MDNVEKNENIQKTVGINFKSLRSQVNFTIEGVSFALSISVSYVLMIERGKANISQKLAKEISNFFGIEIAQLFINKQITLDQPLKIPSVAKFYNDNKENAKFFKHRRSEYSTASFIKNILMKDDFMLKYHTVGEIRDYLIKSKQREIESQELSRELRRLYLKNFLSRKDKFGNSSVYLYRMESK